MPLLSAYIVPHPPLIVPKIGKGEENKIKKTIEAYEKIASKIAIFKPDTIILTTPHSVMYSNYFHISPGKNATGSFANFNASEISLEVQYDEPLIRLISDFANEQEILAGILGEKNNQLDHGTMVPLYYVNQKYSKYKLIRISLSGMSSLIHYKFGKCIIKAINALNRKVVIIASGDLSHKLRKDGPYGFSNDGPLFDKEIVEAMENADFVRFLTFDDHFCESAAECGLKSFTIMAGAFDGYQVKSEVLSYEGPFGVGYAVASFEPLMKDNTRHFDQIFEQKENIFLEEQKANEDSYVSLARSSLEFYVKNNRQIIMPLDLSNDLTKKQGGVFVSLKINKKLRGCIGTILPSTSCIAEEIIRNAVSAGTQDPRFEPVKENELLKIVYSVDVLGEPETIQNISELDPLVYGVIVKSKGRTGLLLPNLEGIDTPIQQVDIALQKAGIFSNEPYTMERFIVVRHY